jgi:hypothetical protein
MITSLVANLLTSFAFGALVAFIGALVQKFGRKQKEEPTLETRVNALTRSLSEATQLISQIETEITTRSELASLDFVKMSNDTTN